VHLGCILHDFMVSKEVPQTAGVAAGVLSRNK
jgi:hypothetical protein